MEFRAFFCLFSLLSNQINKKMKAKTMIACLTIGLFMASCGNAAEEAEMKKKEIEAQLEETRELGGQLDQLDVEIEALEKAEEGIDAAMSELDNI